MSAVWLYFRSREHRSRLATDGRRILLMCSACCPARCGPGPERRWSGPWSARTNAGRPPLPIPHAHVVGDGVAGNGLAGAIFGHVPTVAPDHHGELPLIIELLGGPRQVDVPVR